MITWQHPEWLLALLLLLPLIVLYGWFRRRQRQGWQALGEGELLQRLGVSLIPGRQFRRGILSLIAVIGIVLALANPQVGRRYERVKQRGVDLIVALDISTSMLAEDEQPNRLARAKLLIRELVSGLEGDRIGLIVFAGDAFVQVPLTSDYAAVLSILQPISTDLIARQGTAIGEAIRLATEAFAGDQATFRALIVITDGEDHEGQAVQMAQTARDQGLRIHCVGLGSPQGAVIPEYVAGTLTGNKRDRDGNPVMSRLNPEVLTAIAEAGGGKYRPLEDIRATLQGLEQDLSTLSEQEFDERYVTDYEDQFSWMLLLALFALSLESFFSLRIGQST